MNISINPTYFCNFKCDFCYLTPEQLDDNKLLSIDTLRDLLDEVDMLFGIDKVDLYGGEVGLLPKKYVHELTQLFTSYDITDIDIITNLSMVNDVVLDDAFHLTVSYDFDCREKSDLVFGNMFLIPKPFSVLLLASPCLMEKDVDEMIQTLNLVGNIESVEIKPYSSNQANNLNITDDQFENFVKKWIESPVEKNFNFINKLLIEESILKQRNSFSSDHVYITPNGKFAALEFDENDNEYFLELDSMLDYADWVKLESKRVNENQFCSNCEYYGHCLSEHLREVKSLEHSCNGFKLLLDWYKEEKVPEIKEWKMRQEHFYRNVNEFTDDIRKFDVTINDDIVSNAVRYFNDDTIGWVYPAKSYVVAICYARWLHEFFGSDIYEYLDDPDLLFGNDPYFVPYSQDKKTYDNIIEHISLLPFKFDETKGVVPDVLQYFMEEFLLK